MPHITIQLSKTLDSKTKDRLQKAIAGNMEIIPGKTAANTLICVNDGCSIYKDSQPIEAAFADVRLYKESAAESKEAFCKRLFMIFDEILSIPPSNVQINIIELPCWASNGNYF